MVTRINHDQNFNNNSESSRLHIMFCVGFERQRGARCYDVCLRLVCAVMLIGVGWRPGVFQPLGASQNKKRKGEGGHQSARSNELL